MDATDAIFYIIVLIISVVLHEVAHGFVAEYWGDNTARYAGRLTLNPIKHLEFVGSILLPAVLVLTNAPFLLGWAKPVPYNPNNLRNYKWGTVAVASAGVLVNLFIAVFFGLIIRFTIDMGFPPAFYTIISTITITNLVLFIFNLIPIPPLDGSKILFALLPASFAPLIEALEQYSIFVLILFVAFFSSIIYPILSFFFSLITGLGL